MPSVPERLPASKDYLKPLTRPETALTNKTLRAAALQSLCLSPRGGPEPANISDSQRKVAFLKLTGSYPDNGSPRSARAKQPEYEKRGAYRPPGRPKIPPRAQPGEIDPEFEKMMDFVGVKISQKFNKARHVLRYVDTDNNGWISREEARYFFRFFNMQDEDADKFFDGFEKAGADGEISYTQLLRTLWPYINPGNDEQTPWQIKQEDMEKHGLARWGDEARHTSPFRTKKDSYDELTPELRRARVNICQRLDLKYAKKGDAFKLIDMNRDGVVSRQELLAFFRGFGWEEVADKMYDVLAARSETGFVDYSVFMDLFEQDLDALRLRI